MNYFAIIGLIGLIIVIILIIKYKLKIRELKIKYQLEDKFNKGKINIKEYGIKSKEYILFLKNKSPITIVLFGFFIFTYLIFKWGSKNMFLLNWFFFLLSYFVGLKVMKWLLEFTKITQIDFSKSPYEVKEYEMSYRMKRRFKFLDSDNKESILRNEYNDKDGTGYFVNEINKTELIVRVNKIHNNIDIIRDIVKSVIDLEKYATQLSNENIMLKAKMNINTLINTSKILENVNLLKQYLVKLENKELLEQYKKQKTENDKIDFLTEIKELDKKENNKND